MQKSISLKEIALSLAEGTQNLRMHCGSDRFHNTKKIPAKITLFNEGFSCFKTSAQSSSLQAADQGVQDNLFKREVIAFDSQNRVLRFL